MVVTVISAPLTISLLLIWPPPLCCFSICGWLSGDFNFNFIPLQQFQSLCHTLIRERGGLAAVPSIDQPLVRQLIQNTEIIPFPGAADLKMKPRTVRLFVKVWNEALLLGGEIHQHQGQILDCILVHLSVLHW